MIVFSSVTDIVGNMKPLAERFEKEAEVNSQNRDIILTNQTLFTVLKRAAAF